MNLQNALPKIVFAFFLRYYAPTDRYYLSAVVSATYYNEEFDFCTAKDMIEEQNSEFLDSQLEYLWYELFKGLPETIDSVNKANLKHNRNVWRIVTANSIGSLILVYASVRCSVMIVISGGNFALFQNYNLEFAKDTDFARTIGIPLYSFSFTTQRYASLKQTLPCGMEDFHTEMKPFYRLKKLTDYEATIDNLSSYSHPMKQLKTNNLPDIYLHRVILFKTR